MNIALYKNMSEKNKIGKTLTGGLFYSGTMRSAASVTSPQISIESTDNLSDYNYAYIAEFGRWYFITDIVASRENLWRFDLGVDVLETYKDRIKQLNVIISNSETTGASDYLNSQVWLATCREKTDIINFPSGMSEGGGFVLITAGG